MRTIDLFPAPALAAFLALAPAVFAESGEASIPSLIELPRPFILDQPFLQLSPAGAEILPADRWRLGALLTLSNNWAHSRAVEPFLSPREERAAVTLEQLRGLRPVDESQGIFYVDGEIRRLELSLRRGLGDGIEIGVVLPLIDTGRGIADPIVEPFHQTIGHDNNGREGVPIDAYTVYLRADDRFELFSDRSPDGGLGDLRVEGRARLPAAWGWRAAVRAVVKLPTGSRDRLYGSGKVDGGLQLVADRRLLGGRVHLAVGAVWSAGFAPFGTPSQLLPSATLGYQHPVGRHPGWFAQLTAAEVPLGDLRLVELGREAYIFDLGWQHDIGGGRYLVLAATENNFTFQSSMDFGLHLALVQDF